MALMAQMAMMEKAESAAWSNSGYHAKNGRDGKKVAFARVSSILWHAVKGGKLISEKRIERMFAIANSARDC